MSKLENFIKKSNEIHNYKYSYVKFQYVNAKTSSTIICPEHGEFEQKPDHHTRANAIGCPLCVNANKATVCKQNRINRPNGMRPPLMKKEDFIKLAHDKFGDKFEFDMSNFTGSVQNKIRIKCPIHGWFEKIPRVFMISGHGCSKCGTKSKDSNKTKSYDDFLCKAKILHNDYYSYPEKNRNGYDNRKSKITIVCRKHGEFVKSAQKHLSGQGCFKCRVDELVENGTLLGGYNKKLFNNNVYAANLKGILYYLSLNNGQYFKIGITKNLESRIRGIKCKSKIKTIEILNTYEDTLENVFYLEQDMLEKFNKERISLNFSTELFKRDISNNKFFKKAFGAK